MALTVKPVGYKILIERVANRQAMQIAVPENTLEKTFHRCLVVEVGEPKVLPTGERIPITLRPGDEILFDTRGMFSCGPSYMYGDHEYAIIDPDDVLGVLSGEPGEQSPILTVDLPMTADQKRALMA